MANNRMMLMHRPTGLAVMLGKHMGWGWYGTPDDIQERLTQLFNLVERECHTMAQMEDFCLAMESCDTENPIVNLEWDGYYKEPAGLWRLYAEPHHIIPPPPEPPGQVARLHKAFQDQGKI